MPRAGKMLFLDVSMWVYLEEVSIWIKILSTNLLLPMRVGNIQSVENLIKTKKVEKRWIHCLWAEPLILCPRHRQLMVPGLLDSDQSSHHWLSLLLKIPDFNYIRPLAFLVLVGTCWPPKSHETTLIVNLSSLSLSKIHICLLLFQFLWRTLLNTQSLYFHLCLANT